MITTACYPAFQNCQRRLVSDDMEFEDCRSNSISSKDKWRQKISFSDPDLIKTVGDAAQDLGRYIGRRFEDAVLSAIQKEFDGVYDALGEGERDLALQRAIQSKVADAVEICQA